MRALFSLLLVCLFTLPLTAQDSVDVTFRYIPAGNPTFVHLAGEFNNWANNSNGEINPGSRWTMDKLPDGSWEGAACWRADGTAVALGGGMARSGVRFWPERTR